MWNRPTGGTAARPIAFGRVAAWRIPIAISGQHFTLKKLRPKRLAYSTWESAVTSEAQLSLLRTCFRASFCLNNTDDWTEGYKVVISEAVPPSASQRLEYDRSHPARLRSMHVLVASISTRDRCSYAPVERQPANMKHRGIT